MMKQALATAVFAAGALITGAALAQPVPVAPPGTSSAAGTQVAPCASTMSTERVTEPGGSVANGGEVSNGGYVGPTVYRDQEVATNTACSYNNTSAANYNNNATTWQSNNGGMEGGSAYTFALNDLYSHGFHSVHHMWMQDGMVQTNADTPTGGRSVVGVNPQNGEITSG